GAAEANKAASQTGADAADLSPDHARADTADSTTGADAPAASDRTDADRSKSKKSDTGSRISTGAARVDAGSDDTDKEGDANFAAVPCSTVLPALLPRRLAVEMVGETMHLYAPEIGEIIQNVENGQIPPVFGAEYTIVCYDSKAWWHRLRAAGITPGAGMRDVMLAGYLWRGGDGSAARDALAFSLLHVTTQEVGDAQAALLWRLEEALEERLAADGMLTLAREVEWPLATLLGEMEETGFMIDRAGMQAFGQELAALMEDLADRIRFAAGHPFNVQSTKQLATVLFEELGLPAKKKTKSGYSTDAETLEALRGAHPIIEDILEYRQVSKLYATYAVGLTEAADENDRIHTDFKQALTATGRLSSAEPNLQNIPVRTEMGQRMRRYFVARPGYVLVDADYSQIELRLLAHLSGDERMIAAFAAGADIHTSTAATVFGVSDERVTPEMRKRAKAINFGIVYGMGAHSLAQDLGIPQKMAKAYIDSYFASFPKIGAYLEGSVREAAERGYSLTMYGRRRYIPQLRSAKASERALGRRLALNSPIQGSAADLMKMAMLRVRDALAREVPQARLVMQVHDELIVETPKETAEATAAILRREMEATARLSVALSASAGVADNWLDAKA
ncbi:MAG: hypothetical protein J6125_00110, partial [Clostridia bacterium]|nr:hypothetical protein [Clostridia bacterium]